MISLNGRLCNLKANKGNKDGERMIKVTADSTCDLSPELIETHGIGIVPVHVMIDDADYRDGDNITPEALFRMVETEGKSCRTAAINSFEYEQFFSEHANDHDSVIHISLGSGFSSCYQNAMIAAGSFDNVFVVDSKNLSTGSGHIVLSAVELARKGMTSNEISVLLGEEAGKVEASFVIEKLDYLHRGGRCSGMERFGANLLHIRPCIEVLDNKMAVGKKYRGNYDKCLTQYVHDRLDGRTDINKDLIFVTHSGCSAETVRKVKEAIIASCNFRDIVETRAGCTISSHCGPNTLGILFKRNG